MRFIKLALAAVLALGISGVASADEEAAPDSIYHFGPLPLAQEVGPLTYVPADSTTYGPFVPMPASPWVQNRFGSNQSLTTNSRDSWMLRQTDWVPPGSGAD